MEHYLLIKHLHITFVVLSIGFFCVRVFWSVTNSPMIHKRWVKIVPHLNDPLLLLFGVWLVVLLNQAYQAAGIQSWWYSQPWLWAKWVGLVFYIGFGTMAIKRGKTAIIRFVCALAAITTYVYMLGCAFQKTAMSWTVLL